MSNYFLALAFGTVFLLTLAHSQRLSPMRVWLFMWTLSTIINSTIGEVYYYSSSVQLIILMGVLAYTMGGSLFWYRNPASSLRSSDYTSSFDEIVRHSRAISFGSTFLLCLSLELIDLGMRKFSNSTLMQFLSNDRARMFEIMKDNQAALYLNNELNFPKEFTFVTMIFIVVAILCFYRLSFSKLKRIDIFNAIFLIVAALVFSAAANVRSLLLVPIIVGFFSFYTGCIVNSRKHLLTAPRTLAGTLVGVIGFGAWIIVVQSARMGDVGFSRISDTLDHMRPWFGGYVSALSAWYELQSGQFDLTWGASFFRAVLGPLGIVSGEGFDERLSEVSIGNWQSSNAMTLFRVLILDFGPAGSVLFCLVMGYLGELSYTRAITRRGGWIALLIAFYCAVFYSINYWFFSYGARVFGLFLAILILHFVSMRARSIKFVVKTAPSRRTLRPLG